VLRERLISGIAMAPPSNRMRRRFSQHLSERLRKRFSDHLQMSRRDLEANTEIPEDEWDEVSLSADTVI
jgi:hypothetical protein